MMYRYTPKARYRDEFVRATKKGLFRSHGYTSSHDYELIKQWFKNDYTMMTAFRRAYLTTVFYSKTKLSSVPIEGVLFPVEFFEEQKLSD